MEEVYLFLKICLLSKFKTANRWKQTEEVGHEVNSVFLTLNYKFYILNSKLLLLTFFILSLVGGVWGQTTYYSASNTAVLSATSGWFTNTNGTGSNPTNFTTTGDVFIVQSTHTQTRFASASNTTFGAGVTLQIDGATYIGVSGNSVTTLTVNGTVVCTGNSTRIFFSLTSDPGGGGTNTNKFILASGATLRTGNTTGVVGTSCAIDATTSRRVVTLDAASNFEFNGSANQATLGLPATVNSLIINNSGTAGSNIITLNSGTGTTISNALTMTSGQINLNGQSVTAGSITGSGTIRNGSATNMTLTVGNANNLTATFSGNLIDGSTGTLSLTKAGTGTLTLSGTNSYSGTTTINAGSLTAGSNSAFGTNSAVTLANTSGAILNLSNNNNSIGSLTGGGATGGNVSLGSATLSIGGNNTSPAAYSGIISGTGGLTKLGSGTLILSGANTYSGVTTINEGTLSIAADNRLGTAPVSATPGQLVLGGGTLAITTGFTLNANRGISLITSTSSTIDVASGQTLIYGGIAAGSGSLNKANSGILTLSGANTYTGGTTLNAGTLNINNAGSGGTSSSIGTGTFTIAGGTIDNTSAGDITLSTNNAQNWNADFTYTGGSRSLNLGTGTVTMNASRTVTVSGNTLTVGGAINHSGFSLTKSGAGTLAFGSQAVTLSGLTISQGTLTSTSGTLSLSGNYSNSGTFTHNTGTVRFNGGSAQTVAGATTFNSLEIANTSGGVSFSNAHSIAGTFTLTSGVLTTTATNILNITNTATSAVSGGSASTYVKGPMTRSLLANISADGTTYAYPVADGSDNYRPLELVNVRTGATSPVVRVTLAATGASTPDCGTLKAINSRNWFVEQVSGNFTSATIRLTESSLDNGTALIGQSSTQSGNYTSVGGNSIGATITSNTGMIAARYYAVGSSSVPSVALADNGSQIAAASVSAGTSNHVLHRISLAPTGGSVTLTGMTCTTAGTYVSADVTNLKVYYSTNSTFSVGGSTLLSTLTTPGVAGSKTFPSFTSQAISGGSTGYIYITTDLSASATIGNTIIINALSSSNFTFSGCAPSITGSCSSGGAQTFSAVQYYNKSAGAGALQTLSNWGTNTDGTGTAPINFTANNQIFNIVNGANATITGAWTVSGTNSKVVLGSASYSAVTFTIPSGSAFTGTIDINAASSGSNKLIMSNLTLPTFGTLHSTSTVDYDYNGNQTITATTYGNLEVTNLGTKTFGGDLTIQGSYTQSAGGTVNCNSGTSTRTVTINGDFTLSGTSSIFQVIAASTALNTTITIGGNMSISGTGRLDLESVGSTSGVATISVAGNFTSTATGTTSLGPVDWGTGTFAGNYLKIAGNFSKSGTGTFYTSSTTETPNYGFEFNGTGNQTFSYSGANSDYTSYTVASGSNLVMNTALTLGANSGPKSYFNVNGTIDCGTLAPAILGGATNGTFSLASGATLKTANTNGVVSSTVGSISTSVATRTFNNGANYEFNGTANQSTNFPNATMNNLTINNTGLGGSNLVTLGGAITVNGTLTLTAGLFATTATNVPTIANTSSAAVSGGSTSCFIQGPMKWTLPSSLSSAASVYNFPVGASTTYYPFSLTSLTTGATGPTITVAAFNANSGGIADGVILTALSSTEYWSASASGDFTSGSVSLTRQAALNTTPAINAIGQSSSQGGTYSSIDGTASGTSINNSTLTYSLGFFVMANAIICESPTTQASNITFSNITDAELTINWTNGNGTKRIVKMNTSNSFTNPIDNTDPSANNVYSSGEQVIYNGSNSTVTVTGLVQGTTYHVRVYEANCSGSNVKFNTSTATNNPTSQATTSCASAPTTQATNIVFSNVSSSSIDLSWTNGNGSSRIVKMNTSNSFTNPTNGTDPTSNSTWANSGEQVIFNGSTNSFTVDGLAANTTYHFRVYEKNCSASNTLYITATATNNPRSQTTSNVYKTVTSAGSRVWDLNTTWQCNCVPPSGADVEILCNYVYVNVDATVGNLTIKNGGVLSGHNTVKTLTVSGNLSIESGGSILQSSWTGGGGFSTTIKVAGNFTNNGTMSALVGSKWAMGIELNGTNAQTFSGTGSSGMVGGTSTNGNTFVISNTSSDGVTLSTNFATTQSLDVVTINAGSILKFGSSSNQITGTGSTILNGSVVLKATTYNGHFANSGTRTIAAASTITYTNSASSITATSNIPTATPGNVVIDVGGGTCTLGANLTPAGDLTVSSGTYDLSSFTSNRSTAGGTLTLSAGAALEIGGTGSFPTNYLNHSISPTSTINYKGSNQTVLSVFNNSQKYGNLTLSGSGTKTTTSSLTVIDGNFVMSGTAAWTPAANFTVAGNVTLGGGTLTAGSYTYNVDGNWSNTGGTFTANTSTVNFTKSSSSQTLNCGASASFNNLTHSGAGSLQLAINNLSVGGTFTNSAGIFDANGLQTTVTGSATISGGEYQAKTNTQTFNGGLTLNGGNFTGSTGNINVTNLTLTTGTFTSSSNEMNVTGTFTNNATFTNNSGTVAFTGTSGQQTIGGTKTTTFHNFRIDNTAGVKPSVDMAVNGQLNLSVANPDATNGLLDLVQSYVRNGKDYAQGTKVGDANTSSLNDYNNLDSKVLYMGASSTMVGSADVTGKIRRTSIADGATYTFGNVNMQLTFQANGSALPDSVTVIATRGTRGLHIDKDGTSDYTPGSADTLIGGQAVKRLWQVMKTGGGSGVKFTVRFPYDDSEIPVSDVSSENDFVIWDHHLPYAGRTPHEHGQTNRNTTANWIELTGHGIGYMATEGSATFTKYWMISKKIIQLPTWLGAAGGGSSGDWNAVSNWSTGAVPIAGQSILIPSSAATPNDPLATTMPASISLATIEIQSGGILDGSNSTITLTGGPAANGGRSTFQNNGKFTPGNGSIVIDYTDGTISGNATFNNLKVNAGKKVTIQSSSNDTIQGTLEIDGTLDLNGNPLVFKSGATLQNDGTFSNVTKKVTFLGAGTVTGSNPSTFEDVTLNGALTVNTSPTINDTLTMKTGSSVLTNGISYGGSSTLLYDGTTQSTTNEWTGTSVPNSVGVINSTNLTLSGARKVPGTFTLNNGQINTTSSNILEIGSNASSVGSVNWTSGTVKGPMKRWFSSTANPTTQESGIFPIGADIPGKGVTNRYAQVNFTSNPAGGYIIAEYKTGPTPSSPSGLPITYSGNRYIQNYEEEGYWDITPDNYNGTINSTPYTLKLRMNNPSTLQPGLPPSGSNGNIINDISNLRIISSKGPSHNSWVLAGTQGSGHSVLASGDYLLEETGVIGFSWFNGGGNDANPLPVELISFTGACDEGIISLTWQTASEFNSSHFDVEKSRDGENWQVLTTLPSAGTSNELITYQSTDQNGSEGNNYFRLRQVDIDGTEKLYDPINVSCSEVTTGYFSSFPNPSGSAFQLMLNNKELLGSCKLNITNASGKIIEVRDINVSEGINSYLINQDLIPGIFFMNISNGTKSTPVIRHVIK